MKSIMEENAVNATNVIEVSFNLDREHEIAHPASKNFPIEEDEDDPLEDLLCEFDDVLIEDEDDQKEDFIFHHQEKWNYNVSALNSSEEMVQTITGQTTRLKEDLRRLKYYLDEMNIDD